MKIFTYDGFTLGDLVTIRAIAILDRNRLQCVLSKWTMKKPQGEKELLDYEYFGNCNSILEGELVEINNLIKVKS